MTSYLAALCALLAAAMLGTGDAIEHHAVNQVGDDAAPRGLWSRTLGSRRWLSGFGLTTGAWGFYAAALALGGLLFVQPLISTGVLVAIAVSARLTHVRVVRRAWVMAMVLCAALSVFLVEAVPSDGRSEVSIRRWLIVGGPFLLSAGIGVLGARRARGHWRAAILGASAGAILGITGALSQALVDELGHGLPYAAEHWEPYALALLSFVGIAIVQMAFESGSLAASLPAVQVSEPLVACFLAVALLREHINGGSAAANVLIGCSIAAMIAAVVELARLTASTRNAAATAAGTPGAVVIDLTREDADVERTPSLAND